MNNPGHRLLAVSVLLASTVLPAVSTAQGGLPPVTPYQAELAAAAYALRLNESGNAQKWLQRVPEPSRGWEWKHLFAAADESLVALPGHDGTVTSVDYSRDGETLLAADALGWVRVWDLRTRTSKAHFRATPAGLFRAALSPDGKQIATAGADRTCKLWSLSGEELRTVWQHSVPVSAVEFSPDGRWLAASAYAMSEPGAPTSLHGVVKVYDTRTWAESYELRGGNKPLSALTWSRDGSHIAASSWAWQSLVWPARKDAKPVVCDGGTVADHVQHDAVAFSPDGARIVSGMGDGTSRVYEAESGKLQLTLSGHNGGVKGVGWSRDGKSLITAAVDGTVRYWSAEDGKSLAVLRGHTRGVRSLRISADGTRLASGSVDRSVRIWAADPALYGGGAVRLRNPPASYSVRFSPDGRRLAASGWETISLWDTGTWKPVAVFAGHEASRNALTFSSDSKRLITASDDKKLKAWESETGAAAGEWEEHPGRLISITASPGGDVVAAGGRDGAIRIWATTTGKRVAELRDAKGGTNALAFSPDGKLLVSGSGDGVIRLWSTENWEMVKRIEGHRGEVTGVRISRNGNVLVSGGRDATVRLWSFPNGAPVRELTGHDVPVNCVAISPDGRTIASGSTRVVFHNATTGGETLSREPGVYEIWAMDFSPDGARLATADVGGEIAVLDTVPLSQRLRFEIAR